MEALPRARAKEPAVPCHQPPSAVSATRIRGDYKKAIIALNQALCLDSSQRNGSNAA
ncbi:MAG TPA: hypothetical protein VF516_15015 [Kofleriaceae bacterium]